MQKGFLFFTIVFASAFFFITPLADAQIETLTVSIDGMACPFCAYGVEKKLKNIEGVESVTINIKEGVALLSAKKEESINLSRVPGAVRDAGFTPGTTRVVAVGTIATDKKQRLLLRFNGLEQSLLLTDVEDDIKERLLSFAKTEKPVEIKGIVRERPDGTWALSPETIEEWSE